MATNLTYPDDGRVLVLDPWARRATIPIIACAATSALATSTLLTYLAISDFKAWRTNRSGTKRDSYVRQLSRTKFKNQGFFWLVNLFCADFLQSIGWVLCSYNLVQNRLWPGFACDVQGFFINVGDVGSSVWSLVIAIHTFLLLAGGQRTKSWAAEKSTSGKERWILCACIWFADIFLGLIGPLLVQKLHPQKDNGAGGGWCWIGKNYEIERIFFHYFFVFVDMVALTILYAIVFFYIRSQLKKFNAIASAGTADATHSTNSGQELERWQADLEVGSPDVQPPPRSVITTRTVTVVTEDRGVAELTNKDSSSAAPFSLRHTAGAQSHLQARKRMLQVARSLLWYPMIYLFVTVTLTIGRLGTFGNAPWATTCIFVGAAIYACGGWANVLYYTTTRKGIIAWSWFGWSKNCRDRRRVSKVGSVSDSPPRGPGEKYGSDRSTETTVSTHSRNESSIPDQRVPVSMILADSTSDLQFDGVDFSHSTGFDMVNNETEDDKLVHDRYCVQSRLYAGTPGKDGGECTCRYDVPR